MTNVLFECLGFGMRPTQDLSLKKKVARLLFVDDLPPSSSPTPSSSSPNLSRTPSVHSVDRERILWGDILRERGEEGRDVITHFNEMFFYIFYHLDENWVASNATYMDFPAVLQVFILLCFCFCFCSFIRLLFLNLIYFFSHVFVSENKTAN